MPGSQMQYSCIWEVIAMTNSIKLRAALRQHSMSSSKAGLDTGSLSTAAPPQYIAITKNTFIKWHLSPWHVSKPSIIPAVSVIRGILSFSCFIWRQMKETAGTKKISFSDPRKWISLYLCNASGQNVSQIPKLFIGSMGWFVGTNVIKII